MTYSRLLLFSAFGLLNAQTTPPAQPEPAKQAPAGPAPAQKAPAKRESPRYVRLFSGGISFTMLGTNLVTNKAYSNYDATTVVSSTSTTTPENHHLGAGVTLQVMPWDHFAVQIGALYRETGYFAKADYYSGTDNPLTAIDERKHTGVEETTHLSFYDFPVLVRYYMKDRHDRGWRWYAEAGGTFRLTERVRSTNTIIDTTNNFTTNNTPAKPSKQGTPGYTGGIGIDVVGPMKIHFQPEFRYTRWTGLTFNTLSTVSNRAQMEGIISFVF